MVRNFLSQTDLAADEIRNVFERTSALKRSRFSTDLAGRTLVMFFEKSSTRTRLSFEIGMTQLGGHAVYLDRESSQLSRGESIRDTAEVVSRYADILMARVYAHATVAELGRWATIPVINGLSDEEHPCQTMADFFTILECKGRVEGMKIAYVGDGNNNVTHSLMLGAGLLGASISVAAPRPLWPDDKFVSKAREEAERTGGTIEVTEDPRVAATDADVIYADVWVSMGRETEAAERLSMLTPFQVNAELASAAKDDFIFMHCLPAHVGQEVTADVAYGPHSVIFDQAENRLHVQKALMMFLLDSSKEDHT